MGHLVKLSLHCKWTYALGTQETDILSRATPSGLVGSEDSAFFGCQLVSALPVGDAHELSPILSRSAGG